MWPKNWPRKGVEVEVIDLRTIVPFDSETVLESVQKTNRELVVYEDQEVIGFGTEICAQIAYDAFKYLDAPLRRQIYPHPVRPRPGAGRPAERREHPERRPRPGGVLIECGVWNGEFFLLSASVP